MVFQFPTERQSQCRLQLQRRLFRLGDDIICHICHIIDELTVVVYFFAEVWLLFSLMDDFLLAKQFMYIINFRKAINNFLWLTDIPR